MSVIIGKRHISFLDRYSSFNVNQFVNWSFLFTDYTITYNKKCAKINNFVNVFNGRTNNETIQLCKHLIILSQC